MITGIILDCDECGASTGVEIDGGVFVPVVLSSGSLYVPLDDHWPSDWAVDDGLDLCPACAANRKE